MIRYVRRFAKHEGLVTVIIIGQGLCTDCKGLIRRECRCPKRSCLLPSRPSAPAKLQLRLRQLTIGDGNHCASAAHAALFIDARFHCCQCRPRPSLPGRNRVGPAGWNLRRRHYWRWDFLPCDGLGARLTQLRRSVHASWPFHWHRPCGLLQPTLRAGWQQPGSSGRMPRHWYGRSPKTALPCSNVRADQSPNVMHMHVQAPRSTVSPTIWISSRRSRRCHSGFETSSASLRMTPGNCAVRRRSIPRMILRASQSMTLTAACAGCVHERGRRQVVRNDERVGEHMYMLHYWVHTSYGPCCLAPGDLQA